MSHSDSTFEMNYSKLRNPIPKIRKILLLSCCRFKRFYGTQARKQDLNKTE